MSRDVDILSYLPPVIADTVEFQELAKTMNPELTALWSAVDSVWDNQFINSLNLHGVKRWEQMLKITPLGTDTIEDRRFRILAYLNADIPYTYKQLENMIKNLCGENGYKMELKNEEYTLIIRIALTAAKQLNEVIKLLNRVVPANLVIDCALLYNQYKDLESKTHAELNAFTHEQLRTEVLN